MDYRPERRCNYYCTSNSIEIVTIMDFFDTTNGSSFVNYFSMESPSVFYASTMPYYTTGSNIPTDKDWMPYNFFEYDHIWHKKYAAIKNQMDIMWD